VSVRVCVCERERGCAVMCLFVLEVEQLRECLGEKQQTDVQTDRQIERIVFVFVR
jgi:hypothetical protein